VTGRLLGAALAAAFLVAVPANGAFPGRPGRIVVANKGSILTLRADGTGLDVLTRGHVDCSPVWSPDGRRIAFARSRSADCRDPVVASIYVMNAAGNGLHLLARHAVWPTWSPDGKGLAFFRSRGLFVMRADGSAQHRIAAHRLEFGLAAAADWSPNGRWIAFESQGKLELVRPDGTGLHPIVTVQPLAGYTNAVGAPCDTSLLGPDWSPSGTRIAYTNTAACPAAPGYRGSESSAIVSIKPDGSDVRVVLDPKQIAFVPWDTGGFSAAWSPNGTKIAFLYYDGTGDQIGVVDVATSVFAGVKHELEDDADRGRPDWQPLQR
jgi:Tol biopolymer transport system component